MSLITNDLMGFYFIRSTLLFRRGLHDTLYFYPWHNYRQLFKCMHLQNSQGTIHHLSTFNLRELQVSIETHGSSSYTKLSISKGEVSSMWCKDRIPLSLNRIINRTDFLTHLYENRITDCTH